MNRKIINNKNTNIHSYQVIETCNLNAGYGNENKNKFEKLSIDICTLMLIIINFII